MDQARDTTSAGTAACAMCESCRAPLQRARHPGIDLVLADGRTYTVPPLTLLQQKWLRDDLRKLQTMTPEQLLAGSDEDLDGYITTLSLVGWEALRHNYPDLEVVTTTREGEELHLRGEDALLALFDNTTMVTFARAIWGQNGYVAPGEAPAAVPQ